MAERSKRWYRSRTDKRLAGVLGGLAQYFDIDPTLVRVIYAVGTFFTGFIPGIALYVLLWIVVPPEPKTTELAGIAGQTAGDSAPPAESR